jgi:hypothetical protein
VGVGIPSFSAASSLVESLLPGVAIRGEISERRDEAHPNIICCVPFQDDLETTGWNLRSGCHGHSLSQDCRQSAQLSRHQDERMCLVRSRRSSSTVAMRRKESAKLHPLRSSATWANSCKHSARGPRLDTQEVTGSIPVRPTS